MPVCQVVRELDYTVTRHLLVFTFPAGVDGKLRIGFRGRLDKDQQRQFAIGIPREAQRFPIKGLERHER